MELQNIRAGLKFNDISEYISRSTATDNCDFELWNLNTIYNGRGKPFLIHQHLKSIGDIALLFIFFASGSSHNF